MGVTSIVKRLINFTRGTTVSDTDVLYADQGSGEVALTPKQIATYVAGVFSFTMSAGVGAVARTLLAKLKEMPVTPDDFGAPGVTADESAAVLLCFKAALALGVEMKFPRWYRCSAPVVFDLATVAVTGTKVTGSGRQTSGLQFDTNVASPNLLVTSSTVADAFYPDLMGWGVKGNVAGVVLQVGKEDFSDLINELTLDLVVNNGSTDPTACAVEMNGVYNPDARLVANCGGVGTGDALRLCRTQFGFFRGSYGNAANCVRLTGSYTLGNKFDALDLEMATCAITIDSATAVHNSFEGGTIANVTSGINATAGSCNRVSNPNLGIAVASLVESAVGVTVDMPGMALLATPAVPASGTPYTNNSGQPQFVNLLGGTVSAVVVSGMTVAQTTNVGFVLNPRASVTLAYTAAPSWTFMPLAG
ncbi:hypothetical protein AB3X91_09140 [Paraburkholderia sp. BR14263]|uniref:hypothetical protein n=1 Tax=unclassified Paraburkholderia TaxID=2615204 RepID=UPI0034CF11DC